MKIDSQCGKSHLLSKLVEEQLTEEHLTELEAHLETCEDCQQSLDSLMDGDDLATRVRAHLRKSLSNSDKAIAGILKQVRTTTAAILAGNAPEPIRTADFAVDYLQPSDDPKSLGLLGPYEIGEVIGSGGMGIVLKGNDTKLNRVVAVKVLDPVFASNPTARKRFLREAQAAAVVCHQNVVTIYAVDEGRLPYLVMEFVDGPSLQQRLDSEGFLQLHQILRIGVQIASGLAAAHAQGLVHRDVKPGNILLEKGIERVKLTDFGLARAADDATVTCEGTVVGTPQYMSPEQARGESVDLTSDLFSLGSVLYELATGRAPFRAESILGVMRKITDGIPTPIRELNPDIPDWFCSIVDKLIAKDKRNRFQSANEVHEILEACLSHSQQPTATTLPPIPKLTGPKRIPIVLKTLAGVVAMLTFTSCLFLALGLSATLWPEGSQEN
ncbi:MAG: protein kinase, partial [Planctomycetota bacterium]